MLVGRGYDQTNTQHAGYQFNFKIPPKGEKGYKGSYQDRALLQALAEDAGWTLGQLCEKDDTNFLTGF